MHLTIAIIGHNDAGHLKRSLTAASEQLKPYDGCRVLYADDASTDGSPDLARALAATLGNVDVFVSPTQRNIGGIRNAAVEWLAGEGQRTGDVGQPKGEPSTPKAQDPKCSYIWFHDSDDYLAADAVKRVMETIEKNNSPDCVSVPLYTLRDASAAVPACPVAAKNIEEAAAGPVSECAYVFKAALYVPNPEHQRCEDASWHFAQFDRFETWAKVEGDAPCYVWDNTNPNATTRTVDWCNTHSITLMSAALDNAVIAAGKNDQWISDNLRNLANMYDVRRELKKPAVKRAWEMRFRQEVSNFLNGWHVH